MEKDGKGDMCESRWVLRRRKSIIFPLLNANFHKCDDLCKQWYMLIISVSEGSGVWEWLSWVLCSGSHKAIISVSPGCVPVWSSRSPSELSQIAGTVWLLMAAERKPSVAPPWVLIVHSMTVRFFKESISAASSGAKTLFETTAD